VRWQIELFFRNLKCVLRMENFIATSENGVRLQIYAALIFYVLTHIVMLKASLQVETPVEQMSVPGAWWPWPSVAARGGIGD